MGPTGSHDILEKEIHSRPYRHKISGPSSPQRSRYAEHVTAYGIHKLIIGKRNTSILIREGNVLYLFLNILHVSIQDNC